MNNFLIIDITKQTWRLKSLVLRSMKSGRGGGGGGGVREGGDGGVATPNNIHTFSRSSRIYELP